MAYTYDPIFAADPNNTEVVASNAAILIYNPADAGKAPVTITDSSGSPLANPVTVNKNGFGSAFQHATLDRLAWQGGGFEGFFTSYEGMKNEAVAARDAAEAAAVSAAETAANAGVPTDTAVATAINASGSATATALNTTYATRASAPFTINSVDGEGNPTSITYHVTGGDVTTTYTYGINGVATETTAGSTITYTYDGSGNLTGAV